MRFPEPRDCSRIDHDRDPGRRAVLETGVVGACRECIGNRGYSVQRHYGRDFRGRLRVWDPETRTTISVTLDHGFTNHGFNGIQIHDTQGRTWMAGLVLWADESEGR